MTSTPAAPGAAIGQAIEWHQRLKQGELDALERGQFHVWMQSPANVKELAHICLIDELLRPLKGESPALPENVINFESYAPATRPRAHPPAAAPTPARFTTKIAVAASVLLAVIIVIMVSSLTADPVIATHEGRWGKHLLDDGTVVYAGPRTRLQLHFDDRTRTVELLQGEALFEVAKQSSRPFIVSTDAGRVQALGTAFATAEVGDEVIVTVAEGKVAVAADEGAQPILALGANQQIVLSPRGIGQPVTVDAGRELKWIRDWYEYDGEPVGEIVAQLNQRNEVEIIVHDPQVMRLRMSSLSFRPSQPEDFVDKINRWYADYPHKADGSDGRRHGGALRLQRP